jgi:hypothetical protein
MVDAYATTIGGVAVAVDAQRVLVEDAASHTILSLQPGVRLPGRINSARFTEVAGFSTGSDRFEIDWAEIDGWTATSRIDVLAPGALRLSVQIRNASSSTLELEALCPICVPEEGPGACAVGVHDLRGLYPTRPGGDPQVVRMHGESLGNDRFGAWFAQSGAPSLLIAALRDTDSGEPVRLESAGVRGKILGIRFDSPVGNSRLQSGETTESVALLLSFGASDIREKIDAWLDRFAEFAVAPFSNDFDPASEPAEIVTVEDVPEAPEAEEESDEPVVDDEVEMSETDIEAEGDEILTDDEFDDLRIPETYRRCAVFRRALRLSEGVWPKWGTGRRYPAMTGAHLRVRMLRRR